MRDRAWIELDLIALEHNVRVLRGKLPETCALMPAVKANAYGHGSALISRALQEMGIHAFCVATAREGCELREAGITGDILVLGYTAPDQAELLCRNCLTQTVFSGEYAAALEARGWEIRAHLKIDTGMRRLGVPWDSAEEIRRILACPHLHFTGALTHLWEDDLTREPDRRKLSVSMDVFVTPWRS